MSTQYGFYLCLKCGERSGVSKHIDIWYALQYNTIMNFKWNIEKNKFLKEERNVCFEDVVSLIYADKVLDIVNHPNKLKYPKQKIYIVLLQNYVHMVPFVKNNDEFF